ncbi:MAG: hypothetical protein ACP5M0_03930 [Desulfomonilaceae bacterium]
MRHVEAFSTPPDYFHFILSMLNFDVSEPIGRMYPRIVVNPLHHAGISGSGSRTAAERFKTKSILT